MQHDLRRDLGNLEDVPLGAQSAKLFQHSALKHPRRAIRLCKFRSDVLEDGAHAIELEIAHYTLHTVDQYDHVAEDGILFANFDKNDHVVSFLDENGHRKCTNYIAISYCWGKSTAAHTVGLNGHEFAVSENLYQLLTILRKKREKPLLFWIDQLCINQLDINERNNQVSLMSFIYSSAEAVYAWLGNANSMTSSGLHMLEQWEIHSASSEQMRNEDEVDRLEDVQTKKEVQSLLAAKDLLTREYWTRLWIVQEAIYARKLFFLCGPHKCQFAKGKKRVDFELWKHRMLRASKESDAGAAKVTINEHNIDQAFDSTHILPRTLDLLQDHLFMVECHQEGSQGYIPSFHVVGQHGWRQCSDPRDRIFALQSLVAPSYRVEVNYANSTIAIFYEWVAETTTGGYSRPNLDEARTTIKSLHLAMGLGDIPQRHLNELMEDPQRFKHIDNGVRTVSQSSRLDKLLRTRCLECHGWRILFSVIAVLCAYWLYANHVPDGRIESS